MIQMLLSQKLPQTEAYEPQNDYLKADRKDNRLDENQEDFRKTLNQTQEKSFIEKKSDMKQDKNSLLLEDDKRFFIEESSEKISMKVCSKGCSLINKCNTQEELQMLEKELEELEVLFLNILNMFFSTKIDLDVKKFKQNLLKDDIMILDLLEKENFNAFLCDLTQETSIENLLARSDFDDFLKLSQEVDVLADRQMEILEALKSIYSNNQQEVSKMHTSISKDMSLNPITLEDYPFSKHLLEPLKEDHDTGLMELTSHSLEADSLEGLSIHSPEKTSDFMFSSDNAYASLKSFEISSSIKSFDTTPLFNDKLQLIQNFKEQILKKLDIKQAFEQKEITMQLEPKQLGKLSLKIIEHQGVGTAIVKVETEKAKELFLANVQSLKENLENQGLKIAEFNVNVEQDSPQQEMKKAQQKSSKRIQEIMAKQLQEIEEEEMLLKEKSVHLDDIEELNINYQA